MVYRMIVFKLETSLKQHNPFTRAASGIQTMSQTFLGIFGIWKYLNMLITGLLDFSTQHKTSTHSHKHFIPTPYPLSQLSLINMIFVLPFNSTYSYRSCLKVFFTARPMGGCKDKTICNQKSCLRAENASTASGNAVQTISESCNLFFSTQTILPPPLQTTMQPFSFR